MEIDQTKKINKMAADLNPAVYVLMNEVRKFTRSTLMLQHVIAENIGLHVTDAECIDFLQEMGPSTAGDLAKATRLTTGAITNVIDRLEKSGFVKRDPDPDDRRKVIVSFLPKKLTRAKSNYAALARKVQNLFSGYDAHQLKFLIRHTQELNEIYRAQTKSIEGAPAGTTR
jgi:MarR family transcriptional regulator, organic hydroperoxide resistance regulator